MNNTLIEYYIKVWTKKEGKYLVNKKNKKRKIAEKAKNAFIHIWEVNNNKSFYKKTCKCIRKTCKKH